MFYEDTIQNTFKIGSYVGENVEYKPLYFIFVAVFIYLFIYLFIRYGGSKV
jgi:hypothetical protein